MAALTVQQAFEQALQHQQAGRMREAETLYRQIISQRPNLAEVHNNLGNALKAMGRLDEAAAAYQQALAIRSDIPQIHNNLGTILHEKGQFAEALAAYRQALALRPEYPEAHYNLGNTFYKLAQFPEAISEYRTAIALWPSYAEAHCNLGNALSAASRRDEAIVALRQAVWLRPNYPEAWNNLGNELRAARRYGEAIAAYKQAIAQRPEFPDAYNNLGNALREGGRVEEAIEAYQQAIARRQDYAEAFYNLGIALSGRERLDEAIEVYRHVLQLRPDFADAYRNLGGVLKDTGDLGESLACYRQALSFKPDPRIGSDLVYTLCFIEEDPRTIGQEARRWNDQFARPLKPAAVEFENDRTPDRGSTELAGARLRVGYVSPDFREHPVGRFMLPLLGHHDHACFEIACYTDVQHTDSLTEQLKGHADTWRSTIDLSDEQLAQLVRRDRIDILVDLTMHMRDSRLLTFARKPAPVQVTYLAYAGTTGLEMMDYRLTDGYLDPPGADESVYCERSVRLAHTYWCYQPSATAPAPEELPALSRGHVTFGCLNNFSKVNLRVLETWRRLLLQVPHSKLILYAPEGRTQQRVRDELAQSGVDPQRLEFVGLAFPLERYLEQYRRIDIALDPFPYPGGTTSLDALWMGVPVVTLAGNTALFRAGVSILSNLGRPELIAQTPDQYVSIASGLAVDLPTLQILRQTLREEFRSSPLMNAPRFARDVEAAYRQMWKNWCEGRPTEEAGGGSVS